MAEPNAREVALAHQIDRELIVLTEDCGTVEEAGERISQLLAARLAEYREELAGDSKFIMAAAQAKIAHLLPARLPHCECVLFFPAQYRCSREMARCVSRMQHFVEQGNERDAKRAAKLAGKAGANG